MGLFEDGNRCVLNRFRGLCSPNERIGMNHLCKNAPAKRPFSRLLARARSHRRRPVAVPTESPTTEQWTYTTADGGKTWR